jgi:hypothetical protein
MTSRRRKVDEEPLARKVRLGTNVRLLTNVRDLGTGKLLRKGEEVLLEGKKARRWEALGYVKILDVEILETGADVPTELKEEEGGVTKDE